MTDYREFFSDLIIEQCGSTYASRHKGNPLLQAWANGHDAATPIVIGTTLKIADEHGLLKEGVYEAWREYYYETIPNDVELKDWRKQLIKERSER
ncbi:hypothetical protein D3C75_657100 [compost metagenome]